MQYTNAELIKAGYSKSFILPGSAFWRSQRVFNSNTAIVNFDPVATSSFGSIITLEAKNADLSGRLGGINFFKGAVNMSAAADSIVVECINRRLLTSDSALSLNNPDWLKIPVTINLGNGNNRVLAGINYAGWGTGIDLASKTQLLSGSGNDIIKGNGIDTGISVGGIVSTGAGDDIIEGKTEGGTGGGISLSGGTINMGAGNDRLTGITRRENYLNGWINMGDGNDKITGSGFRFNGAYRIQMGAGDDRFVAPLLSSNTLIEFGAGIDRLYLPPGEYTVAEMGGGVYSLFSTAAVGGRSQYGAERLSGLELLVSKQVGTEYDFAPGVIAIA